MSRGSIRELWQTCFATHNFYVFYLIKKNQQKQLQCNVLWKLIGADIQVLSKSALYHLTHNITSISMTFTIIQTDEMMFHVNQNIKVTLALIYYEYLLKK